MAVTERELASLEAGLDALQPGRPERAFSLRRLAWRVLPPLGALLAVVAVWQLAVWLQLKPPEALPSPADVAATLGDQARAGHLTEALFTTLSHAAVGYALSIALGTLLGIATARVRLLRSALGPILAGLQSFPSVAWGPF